MTTASIKAPCHLWAVGAFAVLFDAIGVFGAFLASLLLLMRTRQALPVFVVSLAAFIVSLIYTYVLTNGGAVMGTQMAVTSAVIAALLVFFAWYAWLMTARHVLG